ncbi:Hypothetical predicted protein [Lecanosticta acicola]|uniref:Uncharacterized protein n=1 Tax=Lecanosticta acicola TaxID=111012 RepID=A0AAI8Z293_9PEZI|nr:Hypothetical predicted protein [Lecanosticta acicola]
MALTFLTPMERDVLHNVRRVRRSSFFRPLLDPGNPILLVHEQDISSLERVQLLTRPVGEAERHHIFRSLQPFLKPEQLYPLRMLLFDGAAVQIRSNTQGSGVESPELVQRPETMDFFDYALDWHYNKDPRQVRYEDDGLPVRAPPPKGEALSELFINKRSTVEVARSERSSGEISNFPASYGISGTANEFQGPYGRQSFDAPGPSRLRGRGDDGGGVEDFDGPSCSRDESEDEGGPSCLRGGADEEGGESPELNNKKGKGKEKARSTRSIFGDFFRGRKPKPLADDERFPKGLWWLAGGNTRKGRRMPTGKELRERKEAEERNRDVVGFLGTAMGRRAAPKPKGGARERTEAKGGDAEGGDAEGGDIGEHSPQDVFMSGGLELMLPGPSGKSENNERASISEPRTVESDREKANEASGGGDKGPQDSSRDGKNDDEAVGVLAADVVNPSTPVAEETADADAKLPAPDATGTMESPGRALAGGEIDPRTHEQTAAEPVEQPISRPAP